MIVRFTVSGVPVGKQRPRVAAGHAYTPKKTRDYEKHVRECWLEQSGKRFPDEVALEMTIIAYFPIPKSISKKKRERMSGAPFTHKADIDNVIKSIADSLNEHAYKDDSRIVQVFAKKVYSDHPRVEVRIEDYGTGR